MWRLLNVFLSLETSSLSMYSTSGLLKDSQVDIVPSAMLRPNAHPIYWEWERQLCCVAKDSCYSWNRDRNMDCFFCPPSRYIVTRDHYTWFRIRQHGRASARGRCTAVWSGGCIPRRGHFNQPPMPFLRAKDQTTYEYLTIKLSKRSIRWIADWKTQEKESLKRCWQLQCTCTHAWFKHQRYKPLASISLLRTPFQK